MGSREGYRIIGIAGIGPVLMMHQGSRCVIPCCALVWPGSKGPARSSPDNALGWWSVAFSPIISRPFAAPGMAGCRPEAETV